MQGRVANVAYIDIIFLQEGISADYYLFGIDHGGNAFAGYFLKVIGDGKFKLCLFCNLLQSPCSGVLAHFLSRSCSGQ